MNSSNAAYQLEEQQNESQLGVQRGSLVRLQGDATAVVVCNDIQCDASSFVLVVPLERRRSRLMAPFAVDMGRSEGFRELHTARADWVMRVSKNEITAIERAKMTDDVMSRIDKALKIALGIDA